MKIDQFKLAINIYNFSHIKLLMIKEVTTPTTLKNFNSPPRKSPRELKFTFLGPNRLCKSLDNRVKKNFKKCISEE